MTDSTLPENKCVTWWERWLAYTAGTFMTTSGFHKFMMRRRLEISQKLTVVRRSADRASDVLRAQPHPRYAVTLKIKRPRP